MTFNPSQDRLRRHRETRLTALALLSLLLAGCEKKADVYPLLASAAPQMEMRAAPGFGGVTQNARRTDSLAYEHNVSIELSKELLPARLQEIEAACAADKESNCTVLQMASSSNADIPSGNIRMRLAPGGVDSIVTLASKDGKIRAQTTSSEDLAQPVADAERELGLLTVHRDRLAEFMKSKELKVEQLITVSRELASVQSQMDSLATQRANLRRRIDTDLLSISLSLPQGEVNSVQSPIMDALKSFGSNLREALAEVIQFLAFALPWLIVIVPGLILLRWFWRGITRWLVRRERGVAG